MVTQNKLLPLLGGVGVLVVGTILWQQFSGGTDGPVKAGAPLAAVPAAQPLPKTKSGADSDNASETLATVVASNKALRSDVAKVLEENRRLQDDNARLRRGAPVSAGPTLEAGTPEPALPIGASPVKALPPDAAASAPRNGFEAALETAADAAQRVKAALPNGPLLSDGPAARTRTASAQPKQATATPGHGPHAARDANAQGVDGEAISLAQPTSAGPAPGAVSYITRPPMGYTAVEERGNGGAKSAPQIRYVRTLASADPSRSADPAPSLGVAEAAARAAGTRREPLPYFTLPENATLTGVRAMTSIIGRVPIDGRVTDPMQFKAMVGRDNLAANGWELPPDVAGIIVSGVAIGDMALSCSEAKVRSLTFVFNDGAIRTVSARSRQGAGGGVASSGSGDLGYLSDAHGSPCIPGKFVTNAPAYLADMVGLRSLGLASAAFADAQRLVTQNAAGGQTTQITDANRYAMGQAVSGATDEVSKWMLSRLKNSFDAVVTPAGTQLDNLVVHLDQEVRLDKAPDARRIVHRTQTNFHTQRGSHHGLE